MVNPALSSPSPTEGGLARLRHRLASLPRDARDTLFLLLVIAVVLAPQVDRLPAWCSVTAAVVLLWRGAMAWRNARLPRRRWLVLLLILSVLGTFASYQTIVGREAGVTLLCLLLVLKTLELRARRDAYVVFFLSFFAILTAFFNSQALGTAAAVFLAFWGLLTALVNANMPAGRPPLRLSGGIALKLMAVGAPVMLALFLLFPRMAPLWGIPNEELRGKTGLSDRMEVGTMASLATDDGIAFRIKFDGQVPPARDMYFRGPVLARFDGRNWSAETPDEGFAALAGNRGVDVTPQGPAVNYEVTLEPNRRSWLFVLEAAPEAPQLPPPYRTRLSDQLQWFTNRPVGDILRYKATSYPQYAYATAMNPAATARYLHLPSGFDPRTHELAQQLRAANPQADARTMAQLALQRLRTGGYTYTLDPGVYPANTADHFWFTHKQGFCEHISSAFVVLMRAAGVPARIVTGYQGGEMNGMDGFWAVRQADAHAWAEVWQAGEGWLRVDPTGAVMPARVGAFSRLTRNDGVASMLSTLSPGMLQQMRHIWDAVNNAWTQRVLNYTQGEQLNLLKKLGFEAPDWRDLLRLLAGTAAVGALLVAAGTLIRRRQRDPWLRLLHQAAQQWHEVQVPTPLPVSPRRLAAAIAACDDVPPSARQAWADWLNALERQRYAPSPASDSRHGTHDANGTLARLRQAHRQLPAPTQWRSRRAPPDPTVRPA
jgi:transglutaminase-like putative cysteine protease